MRPLSPVILFGALAAASPFSLANTAGRAESAVIASATPHDRLFSVIFDGDRGTAVGESGLLMTSGDGGKTWTREASPTSLALIDVATNGKRTIAVGQMGLILVRDGEGPWRKVDSGTDRRLLQVGLNSSGLAFATGAFGTLLKSTDGGETWTDAAPNWTGLYAAGEGSLAVVVDEPTNYLVQVRDDGVVFIGGEYGQIMRSPDGGGCWQIVYRHPVTGDETAPTLFGMEIRSDGVGFAVGQSGLALRTQNGGLSWQRLETGVEGSIFAVTSFANGDVVAVGQRVGVRSRDNGRTWALMGDLDLDLNWYASVSHAASARSGEVVAVGHSARVVSLVP